MDEAPFANGKITIKKFVGRAKRIGGDIAKDDHFLYCPSYFVPDGIEAAGGGGVDGFRLGRGKTKRRKGGSGRKAKRVRPVARVRLLAAPFRWQSIAIDCRREGEGV